MSIAWILYGPLQTGKSMFINLLGDNVVAVGKGDGKPVAFQTQTYQTRIGVVQEIPGHGSTSLQVNSEEIAVQSPAQLASRGVKRARFVLFESLSGDTIQLHLTVSSLFCHFGRRVRRSVIVLATKRDRACDAELQPRLNAMRTIMDDLDIGNQLVVWRSKEADGSDISGTSLEEQLKQLEAAAELLEPAAMDETPQVSKFFQEMPQHLWPTYVPGNWTEIMPAKKREFGSIVHQDKFKEDDDPMPQKRARKTAKGNSDNTMLPNKQKKRSHHGRSGYCSTAKRKGYEALVLKLLLDRFKKFSVLRLAVNNFNPDLNETPAALFNGLREEFEKKERDELTLDLSSRDTLDNFLLDSIVREPCCQRNYVQTWSQMPKKVERIKEWQREEFKRLVLNYLLGRYEVFSVFCLAKNDLCLGRSNSPLDRREYVIGQCPDAHKRLFGERKALLDQKQAKFVAFCEESLENLSVESCDLHD